MLRIFIRRHLFLIGIMLVIYPISYLKQASANQHTNTITLATDHWQPFYGPELENGGFIIEVCRAAFAAVDYQLDLKFMPWKRATKAVEIGIYDGLLGAYYTEKRAKYLNYSNALASEETVLIALESRQITFSSNADLQGYVIGVMRAAVNSDVFDNNQRLTFSYANNAAHNLRKLLTGRIDLMVTGKAHLNYLIKKSKSNNKYITYPALKVYRPPLKVNPIYITLRKDRPQSAAIIKAFNRGIDLIKHNGQYQAIKDRHFPNHSALE